MMTQILLAAAVANTTAPTVATQNGLDIGDYTRIVAVIATAATFALTYLHGSRSELIRIARDIEKISENNSV